MDQADGPSRTGNTRAGTKGSKQRGYFVTFWTHEYPKELPSNATYLCTCEDSTKDGKYHGHAFIYFKNQCTMSAVKKLFGNDCHCEKPHKNSECIAYVKDTTKRKHDIHEYGKQPMDNGVNRTVMELKNVQDPNDLDWRMYNTWKKIHDDEEAVIDIEDIHKDVEVYWIQGPSGIGKTQKAFDMVRERKDTYGTKVNMVKYEGKFWIGVNGDVGVAIYDDFRHDHMKPAEFINFIDYNKHLMNIKGGQKLNKYRLIIITSVQRLEDIYQGVKGEPREQWERRIKVIDMYPKDDDTIEFV